MAGGFRPNLKTEAPTVTEEASFLASEHIGAKRVGATLDNTLVTADADGDKILKAGTLVSQVDATGKYGPYDSAATDGRENITDSDGFIVESVNLRDGDVIVGLLIHGSVLNARVTGVDQAAKDQLSGRILFQ